MIRRNKLSTYEISEDIVLDTFKYFSVVLLEEVLRNSQETMLKAKI